MMLPRERGNLVGISCRCFSLGACTAWSVQLPYGKFLRECNHWVKHCFFFSCIFSFFVWEMSGLSIYKLYIFGWTEDYLMIRVVACHTIWIPIQMTTFWQTKDYFTTTLIVNGGHRNTYVLSSRPICPDSHLFFPRLQPLGMDISIQSTSDDPTILKTAKVQ